MQNRMRKLPENGLNADCLIVHTQKIVVMNVYVLKEICFLRPSIYGYILSSMARELAPSNCLYGQEEPYAYQNSSCSELHALVQQSSASSTLWMWRSQ